MKKSLARRPKSAAKVRKKVIAKIWRFKSLFFDTAKSLAHRISSLYLQEGEPDDEATIVYENGSTVQV